MSQSDHAAERSFDRLPQTLRLAHATLQFACAITLVAACGGSTAVWAATPAEPDLIAVLASDKPESEKAMACKLLAVHGSDAAVPELAKLLANERLASWARIALEAIPGAACDEVLREAAASLRGMPAVGAINSLGVRRDARAVPLLTSKLADDDASVAAASAAALGKIGDSAAAAAVREAFTKGRPDVRPAAAEACVACAERLLDAGKKKEAIEIYDLVRTTATEPQRVLESTRGAILARGDDGIPLLVEQLRSSDRGRFRIGLSTARELPGDAVDASLVAELGRADPDRAALLIAVLADRGSPAAAAAILRAAAPDRPVGVRLAAVRALGRSRDARAIAPLLAAAADGDASIAAAAVEAIATLRAEGVDEKILSKLSESQGRTRAVLLELVGLRRIDAVPKVIESLESDDAGVRAAAITALGDIVDLPRLTVLVDLAKKTRDKESLSLVMKAIATASVRMPDRDACAAALAAAMHDSSTETKVALLDVVGKLGGSKSLEVVASAATSREEPLQDAGTRLLGDWLTPDVGPVLLDIAKTLPEGKFRTRAFRGYLRVARQLGGTPDQKAAMCRRAMEIARDDEDRRAVVDSLKSIPSKVSLELLSEAGADTQFRDAARAAAASILSKAGDSIPGGWELASTLGLSKAKVEIVRATYGAGDRQRDVSDAIRQRVGAVPLIVLPDPVYNKSLGGDPAPGTRKRLVISYRLDGRPGEVSLDENVPIQLPLP